MKVLGYIFATLIVMAIAAPVNGYMISVLWGWFMVPIFNLPVIGVFQAIGLAYVAAALTYQTKEQDKDKSYGELLLSGTIMAFAKAGLFLFTGYIVKSLM